MSPSGSVSPAARLSLPLSVSPSPCVLCALCLPSFSLSPSLPFTCTPGLPRTLHEAKDGLEFLIFLPLPGVHYHA